MTYSIHLHISWRQKQEVPPKLTDTTVAVILFSDRMHHLGWTVRDWIPVGVRFFAHVQTGPGAHLASCTMGTGSFQGINRPGRGADHPPPSSAGPEWVELYLYSPSGPSIGWTFFKNQLFKSWRKVKKEPVSGYCYIYRCFITLLQLLIMELQLSNCCWIMNRHPWVRDFLRLSSRCVRCELPRTVLYLLSFRPRKVILRPVPWDA
jgi:hypothetical protein